MPSLVGLASSGMGRRVGASCWLFCSARSSRYSDRASAAWCADRDGVDSNGLVQLHLQWATLSGSPRQQAWVALRLSKCDSLWRLSSFGPQPCSFRSRPAGLLPPPRSMSVPLPATLVARGSMRDGRKRAWRMSPRSNASDAIIPDLSRSRSLVRFQGRHRPFTAASGQRCSRSAA